MKRIFILFLIVSCNQPPKIESLQLENNRLQKEVDSIKSELQKCEMLIESYEGMPLNI